MRRLNIFKVTCVTKGLIVSCVIFLLGLVHDFTMTAELGLYCDLEWARDMIQSVFSLGSFAGLIVMNLISDTKGRRISTLLSLGFSLMGVTSI
jgi:hypothetical protein